MFIRLCIFQRQLHTKQKNLDADPRAVQQTVFQGVVGDTDNTKINKTLHYS